MQQARAPRRSANVQSREPPLLRLNDIGQASLVAAARRSSSIPTTRSARPASLILIDEATNHTVAAGLVAVSGTVHLVGAGPGAPDLLTVRAARLLGEADIVFHDALVPQEILSLAVKAKKVAVGKRCGQRSTAQQFINKRLLDAARRYRVVVRLKGGDPMLFGRAHEEIDFLAGTGIPSRSRARHHRGARRQRRARHLAHAARQARSVAFVTPRVGEGERAEQLGAGGAARPTRSAIYMGAGEAAAIAAR